MSPTTDGIGITAAGTKRCDVVLAPDPGEHRSRYGSGVAQLESRPGDEYSDHRPAEDNDETATKRR